MYVLAETRHLRVPTVISREIGTGSGLVRNLDEFYYRYGAESLVEGNGFRYDPLFDGKRTEQAYHPPLTSILLTPVAALGGGEVGMRLAMTVMGAAVVSVVGLLGRATAGPTVGLIAAGLAAVYPNLWMNDGVIMAETPATLFTAVTALLAYRLVHAPTWWAAAATGAAAALAMLTRSELALLVPLVVVPAAFLAAGAPFVQRAQLAVVGVVVSAIVVAPWVGSNLSRFEEPTFLATGDGDVLLGANCDETYEGPLLGFVYGFCGVDVVPVASDDNSVDSARRRDRAFEYIGDHLGRLPTVVAARVGRAWHLYRPMQQTELSQGDGRPRWASVTGLVAYWLLAPAAVAGALLLWRARRRMLSLLVAPIVIATLTAAVFLGHPRYRVPAEVSIVVLAAVAIDALWRRWEPFARQPVP